MKKNNVLTAVFVIACVLAVGIAGFVVFLARNNFGNEDLICDGVMVGSIDVGGMTADEARGAIDRYILSQEQKPVIIDIEEHQLETVAGELGISYPDEDLAAQALAIGKDGNLWERFREIRKAEAGEKNIPLEPDMDETVLQTYVEEQCTQFDVKAKNSRLKMKNGSLHATKSKTGLEVRVEETVDMLKEALSEEDSVKKDSIEITADVEVTEPKYTQEVVSQCTDLLGSYSTTYSTYQVERSSNVATAAGRINGTMLYPGQTFSTIKVIKDRTEENGYKAAPEYSSGKVVEGIGGGVCQVSTTLYNAVINAELKIVERSPHSMVVSYVPVSRDAAISGDYKDFKFKNNTDYPVFLVGSASGGVLQFKVYGYETRESNRKISFEPEIIDTIEPGAPVETVDASMPESYRSVTQSAHVGYKAALWKIVTVDGVETERIQINTSSYNASPEYVTVGKLSATPTPEASASAKPKASDSEASDKKSNGSSSAKNTAAPNGTKKPEATPKATAKKTVENAD